MSFGNSVCYGLLLVWCVVFVAAVKSRPVDSDNGCAIMEKYKCGQHECNCRPAQVSRWPGLAVLFRRLLSYQSPLAPTADERECDKCELQCERRSAVKCINGVCRDNKCACLPCWNGKSCDQPDYTATPKFEQSEYTIDVNSEAAIGSDLLAVVAFDPCVKNNAIAPIKYAIPEGNEGGLFQIDSQSGRIRVARSLESSVGDVIRFTVEASKSKGADQSSAKAHVSVTVSKRGERHRRSAHHIMRRSLATATVSPSLYLRITAEVGGNYTFYNKGDQIQFRILLSHNDSASTKEPTSDLAFECSDQYLTPKTADFLTHGVAASAASKTADDKLQFTVATLNAADVFNATIPWAVKNTIPPLANLYISCHVLSTGPPEYKAGPVQSMPILYGVFPKVTLTRTSHVGQTALDIKSEVQYKMAISMPLLNFPLLVEISSAINEFSFMEVFDATVTTQSSVTGVNRQPTPAYHKSNTDLAFNDRSVLQFGNLTVTAADNNQIVVDFKVRIFDHPKLANGSKHWVGAGMRSGYQMLWVGQEAIYVTKNEPAVAVYLSTVNDTLTTRYYKGDRLSFTFTVNHTSTSTADAQRIKLFFYSKYLTFISVVYQSREIANHNNTAVQTIAENSFPQGTTHSGTIEVEVNQHVNPLVQLDVIGEISYQNMAGEDKMKTKHKANPPYVAGVPVFVLNKTTPGPHRIGSKACFTFSAMIRRLAVPLIMEIIAPINGSAIFSILDVSALTVGSNIENHATLQEQKFSLYSTVNDTYFDRAILDLGTVKSFVGTEPSPLNKISFTFCALLNDHANITNGSTHWVGVGIKGGPRMMWIGEVAIVADVPLDRKPVLKMEFLCAVPGSDFKCSDTKLSKTSLVEFNVSISHDPDSQQHAQSVNALVMIPPYVKFYALASKTDRLTHVNTVAGPKFTDSQVLRFMDSLKTSFTVRLDPSSMPPGATLAVSVADVTYEAGDTGVILRIPLTPVTVQFHNPDPSKPPTTPSEIAEYYDQGIYVDTVSNTLFVCKHNLDSLKSSCFYSTNCGSGVWTPMDRQVAAIIGKRGDTLYGVSKNKRAYLKQTAREEPWEAIDKATWEADKSSAATDKVIKITDSVTDTSDNPASLLVGASSKEFGANKKGIFCRDTNSDPWAMKAQWSCCGN